MKAAIQAGSAPVFAADKELAKSAATRVELDSRRAVAVGIVEDLRSDERAAELEVADAQKGVEFAVTGVLKAEAVALADSWRPLAEAARRARARLGRHRGPVSLLMIGSAAVSSAIGENEKDQFDLAAVSDVDSAWEGFAAKLLIDASARLDFTHAEASMVERANEQAERKARTDAIVARMNATA
jgi:hypothetical protein